MVKKKETKKKCSCKIVPCLIGLVLMVIGFYAIIMGFTYQLMLPGVLLNWMALTAYLVGFVLVGIAKHLKMHAMIK